MSATETAAPAGVDLLLQRAQDAIAFERERADTETARRKRAEEELGAFMERVGSVIAAAGAAERRRAVEAESEVARLTALLDGRDNDKGNPGA
jgi:hypothetical protein